MINKIVGRLGETKKKHISYLFTAELEHEILSHFNGVDNHSSSLSNEAIKLEDYLPMETELTP